MGIFDMSLYPSSDEEVEDPKPVAYRKGLGKVGYHAQYLIPSDGSLPLKIGGQSQMFNYADMGEAGPVMPAVHETGERKLKQVE